jgi:hypothetical protein
MGGFQSTVYDRLSLTVPAPRCPFGFSLASEHPVDPGHFTRKPLIELMLAENYCH